MSSLRDLLERGERDAARDAAQARLETSPHDVDALATLAKLAAETGDFEAARSWLSKVAAQDRGDYDVGLVEAMLRARAGDTAGARRAYLQLAFELPDRQEAHFALGFLLMGLGEQQEAIAPLTRAIEVDPKNWAAHFYLAGALIRAGETQRGLTHLQRTLELNPLHPPTYLAWVAALEAVKKLDEAERLLREGLRLMKDEPSLLTALSGVLVGKRDLRAALAVARQRAERTSDPRARDDVARLLLAMGQPDEALATCAAMEAEGQASATTYLIRAFAFEAKGEVDESVKAYRAAMRTDPKDWAAANNLGLLLSQRSERDPSLTAEARAVLEEAIRREPNRSEPKLNLAILLGRLGDVARAVALASDVESQATDESQKDQARRLLVAMSTARA